MRSMRLHCKKLAIVAITGLFMLMVLSPVALVLGHAPGAKPSPEFLLDPIIITDGGKTIELTPEPLSAYHDELSRKETRKKLAKEGKSEEEIKEVLIEKFGDGTGPASLSPCGMSAYRAVLYSSNALWDGEIPRSEISIESRFPGGGSRDSCCYITGVGKSVPNVAKKGIYALVIDGKVIPDASTMGYGDIRKLSKNIDISYFSYKITNLATGESVELQFAESSVPKGYFELRNKVKFGDPDNKDRKQFTAMWEEIRDNTLLLQDWELFEGVSEPPAPLPIVPIIVLFGTILLIAVMWIVGKRRKF